MIRPSKTQWIVVFEKAVVENDAGKFMCYTAEGAEEIKIEKKEIALAGGTAGNISDLGVVSEGEYIAAIEEMAEAALLDGCTATNPRVPTKKEVMDLYRAMW